MTQLTTRHSYEELRAVVVDVLLGREPVKYTVNHYRHLVIGIAEVLARREGQGGHPAPYGAAFDPLLHSQDTELVRDIFWEILADDKLQPIFGGKKMDMFQMTKAVNKHLK